MKADIILFLDSVLLMLNLVIIFFAIYKAVREKATNGFNNASVIMALGWVIWLGWAIFTDLILYQTGAFELPVMKELMNQFIGRKLLLLMVNALWAGQIAGLGFERLKLK